MSPLHQVSNNKGTSMNIKPVWYEHNLHNERGEVVNTVIADYDGLVFGKPGIDYSSTFKVVTQTLEPLGVKPVRISLGKGEYDQKPAWYEHTLHNDRGEAVNTIIADHDGPAFGRPDVDYDKLFSVEVVPLYYPGEVERLRAELGEAKGEYDRAANKVAALTDQLAALEALHGGELGLPKEGWPEYHKRKMESMRDLTAARYERKLAGRDALLRDAISDMTSWCVKHPLEAPLTKHLIHQIEVALSASAEPVSDLCAEGAHEFVPFQDNCVKCNEPYQAAPVPKVDPTALRVGMENLAVRATYGVDQPPVVVLNGTGLRVHYSGMKWYHEHLVKDRWTALTVDEFDALLTEALAKS